MVEKRFIGLIPAAGKGQRLGLPYPKELYPIISDGVYKPVAQFVMDAILAAGVKHIAFVINETKHQLIGFFGSGKRFNAEISYVYQENPTDGVSTSPGLATALSSAYHLIKDHVVLFGMPDTIMEPTDALKIGLDRFDPTAEDVLLCLFPTKYPEKFGMVETDASNRVIQVVDKPAETELKYMWGCIIWGPKFTEFLNESVNLKGISDFATILNRAINAKLKIKSVEFPDGRFEDFGTYEQIIEFRQDTRIP